MKNQFRNILLIIIIFLIGVFLGVFYKKYYPSQIKPLIGETNINPKQLELTLENNLNYDDLSTEKYLAATLKNEESSELCKIKIHGNYTATLAKKPIRLKCNDQTQVLLANYTDKSLLRNFLAFEIGDQLNFPYNTKHEFVNLKLNGQELGNYLLTDHISSTAPQKIGLETNSEETIQGINDFGFMIEISDHLFTKPEENSFITENNTPIEIKYPSGDDLTSSKINLIENYINKIERKILYGNPANLSKYLDIKSAANWYLLNEITGNPDAGKNSIYLYKKSGANQKLTYGPIWDYDLAFGNYDKTDISVNPADWPVRENNKWLNKIYQNQQFKNEICQSYQQTNWSDFLPAIDKWSLQLANSQKKNYQIWPTLNTYIHPNAVVLGDYYSEVNYAKSWFESKINYFDQYCQKN